MLAGGVDALFAEIMMTFSLPAFRQPLVPSMVWLGILLLPQANQNVNAEDCREALEGEPCCAVHQCEPEAAAPCQLGGWCSL